MNTKRCARSLLVTLVLAGCGGQLAPDGASRDAGADTGVVAGRLPDASLGDRNPDARAGHDGPSGRGLRDASSAGDRGSPAPDARPRDARRDRTTDAPPIRDASPRDGELDAAATADAAPDVSYGDDCGHTGQSCCGFDNCYGGGCCVDYACVANGDECPQGLGRCDNGGCGTCGALGEACCGQYQSVGCSGAQFGTPLDAGTCPQCTQTGTWCSDSFTCTPCGGIGQTCCQVTAYDGVPYNFCTDVLSICVDDSDSDGGASCEPQCGAPGQSCCQNNSCIGDACCMSVSNAGTLCVAAPTCGCTGGECTTCGLPNQACCEGGECAFTQGACAAGPGCLCEGPPGQGICSP